MKTKKNENKKKVRLPILEKKEEKNYETKKKTTKKKK